MEKKIAYLTLIVSIIKAPIISNPLNISRYFWANYQHFQKNPQKAEFWYAKLFENEVPLVVYEGYIQFLFATKKFPLIYGMKDFILSHFVSNVPLLLVLQDVLIQYKEDEIMHDVLLKAHKKHSENSNLTLRAVSILLERKDINGAIGCIDALLNKTSRGPSIFLFHFMKAQMYLQINRLEDAIFTTKQSLELFNYFDKAWLMLAVLYEQLGNIPESIHAYQQYTTHCEKPLPLFTQRLLFLELQNKQLDEKIREDHGRQESKNLIYEYIAKKQYSDARRHIEVLLKYEPNNSEIKKLKVKTLVHQKQHRTASDTLQAYIKNDSDHRDEWIGLCREFVSIEKEMDEQIRFILQKYATAPIVNQCVDDNK